MRSLLGALLLVLGAGPAMAQVDAETADEEVDPLGEIIVVVDTRSAGSIARDQRAVSVVDQEDLEAIAPRTAPEALRLAPGVSVQKTNHAGGSPYVRGTTGQQTLLMIDGFRLNTSIMRAGPNQYFATVDPDALRRIEVLRGAGSVLYGSDAIGGVIEATTRDPLPGGHRARGALRAATAEDSLGGRVQYDGSVAGIGYLAGIGARDFGNLRGAGSPALAEVPIYDGDEQLFTSYDEVSGNAKVVAPLGPGNVIASALVFRQHDAPRTDKCNPGPPFECRFFDEQSYDLGYLRYRADLGLVQEVDVGVAFARTHEVRSRHRESRDVIEHERDDVLTLGIVGRASTPTWRFGDGGALRLSYGADIYSDSLASKASDEAMSTGQVVARARGKYLDGSSYLSAAAYGFGELLVDETMSFTAGARLNTVRARVADDPAAGAPSFVQWNTTPVASAGTRLRLAGPVFAVATANQGFRAPNLDDLTALGDEGPGYQLANPSLGAERSLSLEAGLQVRHERAWVSAFAFTSFIDDFIAREAVECPPELAARCGDSDRVYRLVNVETARIRGVELAAQAYLDAGVSVLATATWTRGDKQVSEEPAAPREPLSKIPPVHGVVRVRFEIAGDYFAETDARWALDQDRLSPADLGDPRIPPGGTPAYGVVDVRVGARWNDHLRGTLAVENLADTGYRVHGSGVDGAGFNVVLAVSGTVGVR
jgi:iron complex outermembrane receptor protein/hemoglobin/transferrin/lactoferrin receptor protein